MSLKRKTTDVRLEELRHLLCETECEIETLQLRADQIRKDISAISNEEEQAREKATLSKDWKHGFKWDKQVDAALEVLGYSEFRKLQRESINAVLSGQDTFSIMPTGAGKSLCFQLPAFIWAQQRGVVCIISPLLSLMEDQVTALREKGLDAEMLCSATDKDDKRRILNQVAEGTLSMVYATPEFLVKTKTLLAKLQQAYHKGILKLFVIDEAHCCSTWGHDFRSDYLKLSMIRETFPTVPVLALTATATEDCRKDVTTRLKMKSCLHLKGHYNRPNLTYSVLEKPSKKGEDVKWMAKYIKKEHEGHHGLIYCLSCKDVDNTVEGLRGYDIKVEGYHASMDTDERQKSFQKWATGASYVIVATIAFGMGIDKSDVRFVIHHSTPKSVENYYQESGRAGRDGKHAECIVLFKPSDITRLSCLIAENANRENNLARLYELAEYMDPAVPACRRRAMAVYFGDAWKPSDCKESCDYCSHLRTKSTINVTGLAETILAVMKKAPSTAKITPTKLVEALVSKNVASMQIRGGAPPPLKNKPQAGHAERIVLKLLHRKNITEDFIFTPYGSNSYLTFKTDTIDDPILLSPMPQAS
eukprot:TRINITY_DN1160_c1_g1_i1.p1 TRINITY_DN1160_c1_g1~~TRINITY_DN1160_c1_g1_i1.p1  ORF type:complete len:589 (+),score=90.71 TRINITY_DN1160_c1_g1_i1:32-1798(+)